MDSQDQQKLAMMLQSQPRERSYILAQVLQQLNQQQPQMRSWGEFAGRLGAQGIRQNTANKEMAAGQQAQMAQAQQLAQALQQYQQQSRGGMQSLPGTGVKLDTLPDQAGAQQGLMGSLVQNQHPMAQQMASQMMSQMLAPPREAKFVDAGDRLLDPVTGRTIPKNATPDTALRERGENERLLFRDEGEDRRLGIRESGEDRRLGVREAGDNARAQVGADYRALGNTQKLRKEHEQSLPVQQYRKVLPQVQGIVNAPDTPAGDLAVINGVAKIMDPDTGIREQDVNNVLRSTTPMQAVIGDIRFFVDGKGRMTPESRKDLMDAVGAKVGGFKQAYDQVRDQFSIYAKQQGVDPFDVVGPAIDEGFTNLSVPKIQSQAEYEKLPAGSEYFDPQGKKRRKK